jgi:hypothetical protein
MTRPGTEHRERLVAALQADLVGPDAGVWNAPEDLPIAPSRWYLTGFLACEIDREPQDPEVDDDAGSGDDVDEGPAPVAPESNGRQRKVYPASAGLSFLLPPVGTADGPLSVEVRFATYARVPVEGAEAAGRKRVWRRTPHSVVVDLGLETLIAGLALPGFPGVRLEGCVEVLAASIAGLSAGTRAVSLFIVNAQPKGEDGAQDEAWLFQVEVAVRPPAGSSFLARPDPRAAAGDDPDEKISDLRFRERLSYAVGHGVGVEEAPDRVAIAWIPRATVRRVVPADVDGVQLGMEVLAALEDPQALRDALTPLVAEYRRWIEDRAAETFTGSGAHQRTQTQAKLLHQARIAADRLAAGIDALCNDDEARRAFALMNRAMALAARQRSPERYTGDTVPSWRPFQLGFVLLNAAGLVVETHEDRETLDLLFFPTGGGKTEAYLGVIGLALLLRRLRGGHRPDGGLGVAVLLRYTLRLLTLDQLGRAATLICALEVLRRGVEPFGQEGRGRAPEDGLGGLPFAVGLWVGKSATANTLREAARAVDDFKNGRGPTPFPLTGCPWCAAKIEAKGMTVRPTSTEPTRIEVACVAPGCAFNARAGGLPVVFVDEQIYRELPAFIVATVDKFAMLPWRAAAGALFGRVHSRQGQRFFGTADSPGPSRGAEPLPLGLRPPELVVQDEVHLIAGPLGTLTGLYEAAIDVLCQFERPDGARVRPKIVASTATVRRAGEQMQALFGLADTQLFPPVGPSDTDDFFSRVDEKAPDRLYLGVAAGGRPLKAVSLRVYATLLAAGQRLANDAGSAAADPWTTLVGYFNALRELGGMRRVVEDDVMTRVARAEERVPTDVSAGRHAGGAAPSGSRWLANRTLKEPVELTSRASQARIQVAKDRLGKPFSDEHSVDVALATNMISVGLDIDRLGLMVVSGQPKSTAEYIQATSRVGRQHPGLVVTCFSLHRPRDRSHYEHFSAFHAALYRRVEANSLTPFSAPALDRGLGGVLFTLARLGEPELVPGRSVMQVAVHRPKIEAWIERFVLRAKAAMTGHDAEAEAARTAMLRARLLSLLDQWQAQVTEAIGAGAQRKYSELDGVADANPLMRFPTDTESPNTFVAPTSMRDVEPSVHIWLDLRPDQRS